MSGRRRLNGTSFSPSPSPSTSGSSSPSPSPSSSSVPSSSGGGGGGGQSGGGGGSAHAPGDSGLGWHEKQVWGGGEFGGESVEGTRGEVFKEGGQRRGRRGEGRGAQERKYRNIQLNPHNSLALRILLLLPLRGHSVAKVHGDLGHWVSSSRRPVQGLPRLRDAHGPVL